MREMPELKVEEIGTDELIPYANNAKIHTREQVDQICKSIEEFGFNDPVAVWEGPDGLEIVEGHGRVMAAKKLNIEQLPVIRLDHLSDEQRRAYTHVHNQLTMNTDWDFDTLSDELDALDFDSEYFGFNTSELIEETLAVTEEEKPEIDFGEVVDEENNYIVLKFTNAVDWINAQSLFELKQCKRFSTRTDGYLSEGMTSIGLGRVIDGAEAINRLLEQ